MGMQQQSDLPEGWLLASLPQMVKINMGQSPPGSTYNNKGDGIPFFQGKVDFTDVNPKVRIYCTEPKKIASEGDILLSIRAPVGPTNIADQKCAVGRGLAALTPYDNIPTHFILYLA
jgi:type I restriction enzyme S subunit